MPEINQDGIQMEFEFMQQFSSNSDNCINTQAQKSNLNKSKKAPRAGCKDIWNAFMCKGAQFGPHDIPYCPTTAKNLPKGMILWEDAKHLYKQEIARHHRHFHCNKFVCFYQDDYKFDGPQKGIWNHAVSVLKMLRHFDGCITPDFSTYRDFPEPEKMYNTFRMRKIGYWLGRNGIQVINNVRWGTQETWNYCWVGIPKNSVVCIGTVASGLRNKVNKHIFEVGLRELIRILQPHTILVYGSANYNFFHRLTAEGISIVTYPSKTAEYFSKRTQNV